MASELGGAMYAVQVVAIVWLVGALALGTYALGANPRLRLLSPVPLVNLIA